MSFDKEKSERKNKIKRWKKCRRGVNNQTVDTKFMSCLLENKLNQEIEERRFLSETQIKSEK